MTTKQATREQQVRDLARRFGAGEIDKWTFYPEIARLKRIGRFTYAELAELTEIRIDVIAMRLRDLRAMEVER